MKLVELSIRYPTSVSVGVILVVLFGVLSLLAVPVQLTPDVDLPTISVVTNWAGASPQEIEREIIDRQEKELKSLEGLKKLTSESVTSQGTIKLEFQVGIVIEDALLKVNNALQRVPRYPENADKPILISANQDAEPIAWMVVVPKDLDPTQVERIERERTFVVEKVVPQLERVPGIAQSQAYGGRDLEMQVRVDPRAVAAHGLTMDAVSQALTRANNDLSAGGLDEGKRRYRVRTESRFREPADAEQVVVAYDKGTPVKVSDLGQAQLGYAEPDSRVLYFGYPTLVMSAVREVGTNVMEVMAGLKQAIVRVNRDILSARGLEIIQVYDETEYIQDAIDLVQNNIWVGGLLAVVVLFIFLRSWRPVAIIAFSIPISLVGTFIMMRAFGRSINVISLAGLAFASGMVVDAAIVVLENIYRRRQEGEDRPTAALNGANQVWGAILASTLTTMAVFLPVLRIQEEAGQLFADIAIAISFAVMISMVVAVTVIPSLASRIMGRRDQDDTPEGEDAPRRWRWDTPLMLVGGWFRRGITGLVWAMGGSNLARVAVVVLMTGLALGMAWFLAPKTEYLPSGDRNMILGILIPPPGYSVDQLGEVGQNITTMLQDHWGPNFLVDEGAKAEPHIRGFFYVAWQGQAFMGLIGWNDLMARALIPVMYRVLGVQPGLIPIVQQSSLFSRGLAQGRSIDLDLTGPELERLAAVGQQLYGQISAALPDAQIWPIPGLELNQPEVRFVPDRVRAAAVGLDANQIGFNLDVLVEGAKIDEVSREGFNIDLKLMPTDYQHLRTQDLGRAQLNTPRGELVTLESVAEPKLVGGPTQINHIERDRAITLRILPPERMPLQEAMDIIQEKVVGPLRASGQMAPPYGVSLSGTADDLTRTRQALQGNFLLALAITFLLMAALFESYVYPLVIMFSVPLAAAGGFLGLFLVNAFLAYQALDVLTMLGFVILVGIVVNNAILIVDMTLQGLRLEGLAVREAIRQAVDLRVRPIFMSTLTSIFGMLPLVLFPGAGSELYRGLGSVVVGGLAVSTLFTLFLIPALLGLVLDARQGLARLRGREFRP